MGPEHFRKSRSGLVDSGLVQAAYATARARRGLRAFTVTEVLIAAFFVASLVLSIAVAIMFVAIVFVMVSG